MSEPANVLPQPEADERRPGLMKTLRRWLAPLAAETSVRDVIEELIEGRIEENPESTSVIDANERLLLGNVLKLRNLTAHDIMVPRVDIVAIDVSMPLEDALAALVKERHSRLPVYRETLDDVVGFVHIKDAAVVASDHLAGAANGQTPKRLADLAREILFVSPAVRVLDLLLEMRLRRTHMALVVDEYGGIDGLVTIEDVVEQIVGEIEDEHDSDETPSLSESGDGTVVADARVTLADFESRFGPIFSDEEREATDTLGGLVISLAGRVPGRGGLTKHVSGLEFEVLESDPRKVRQLRVRGIPAPPAAK